MLLCDLMHFLSIVTALDISAGFNANYSFNNVGTSIYGGYYPEGIDKQDALGAAIVADPIPVW